MITIDVAASKDVSEKVLALAGIAYLDTTGDLVLRKTFMEGHAIFEAPRHKPRQKAFRDSQSLSHLKYGVVLCELQDEGDIGIWLPFGNRVK
jgi:hypothetical protein